MSSTIGKSCVCCGEFIPIESIDEKGYRITYQINSPNMCSECFDVLKSIIINKREGDKNDM